MRRAIAALVGLALAVTAIAAGFIVGMRRKSPLVLDAVRRMNRSVGNPRQMKSAGTPGAYASVIKHVGRSSGRPYETPVSPIPTDDGFLIALPYGTRSDWLKNVMAAVPPPSSTRAPPARVDHPNSSPRQVAPNCQRRNSGLSGCSVDQCPRPPPRAWRRRTPSDRPGVSTLVPAPAEPSRPGAVDLFSASTAMWLFRQPTLRRLGTHWPTLGQSARPRRERTGDLRQWPRSAPTEPPVQEQYMSQCAPGCNRGRSAFDGDRRGCLHGS
jgi:hypothetical protein